MRVASKLGRRYRSVMCVSCACWHLIPFLLCLSLNGALAFPHSCIPTLVWGFRGWEQGRKGRQGVRVIILIVSWIHYPSSTR